MNRIDAFLELVVNQGGSDLHLVAGNQPRIRLNGEAHIIKYRELSAEETEDLLYEIMPEEIKSSFREKGGADFAYEISDYSRFRVNIFKHINGLGAVFRVIPTHIKTLNELGLPPVIKNFCRQQRGLILVTGPTGSGKSTTLAAMVDFINTEKKGHIITIEDPIEFIHKNKNCLISQREVGVHTDQFSTALRSSLREDPNVVLVGELRDFDTIHMALTAAETGILVIATLHTSSAASSIDRIINVFPPGEEHFVRTMLSTSLVAVISQQLLRGINGKTRVAAHEIMINNSAISNVIREGNTEQFENVMQSSISQGMQLMDTSILRLFDAKLISGEEAYLKSKNKSNFEHYCETGIPDSNKDKIKKNNALPQTN